MADIRPTAWQPAAAPQGTGSPSAARTAAQRAFFDAALGRTGASAAPTATPATASPVTATPPRTVQTANLPDEPPKKILRPGSLLDIRV